VENTFAPIKIAILGAGEIAQKVYLPLLLTWPTVEIVGLYSRSKETVDHIAMRWQLPFTTTSLDDLLERRPQAVFILTATPSHYELAMRALEAGLDVYVEKPATRSSVETLQLAGMAHTAGLIFMVGFNRRFAPLYLQAKEIFAGRHIQLCILEKHRTSPFHTSLFNNYLDDTIHQIDLLRFFCGNGIALHTSYEMRSGKLTGALSLVSLTGGGMGVVATSLLAGSWQERLSLHGDGLSAEVSAFRELRVKYQEREEVYGLDRPGRWMSDWEERGFVGEVRHFFDCISERKSPLTDGVESARTQELMEAMVRCAKAESYPANE